MKSISKSVLFSLLFIALFCAFSFGTFADDDPAINLSRTSATIGQGEEIDLYSFITDEDKDENEYTYVSDNETVASVDESAVVTGNKTGTANITITLHTYRTQEVVINEQTGETEEEKSEITVDKTFKVTVKSAAKAVKLNYRKIALQTNKTFTLKATLTGTSFSRKFVSSNNSVATVDSNGVVKARKAGTVVITYKTFNNVKDSCVITVTNNPSKLTVTSLNVKIQKGSNFHKITYKFAPGGVKSAVSYVISNKAVISISSSGYVTGLRKGNVTIKLKTAYENVFAIQKLVVIDNALSLNVNSAQLALDRSNVVRQVYGKSVNGRPLEAYIITNIKTGTYKKTLFMDFAVHGFEDWYARDAKALANEANRIIQYYANHSELLGNYRLVIIPCANPDGTIAGKNNLRACRQAYGRCTARHVDMNRDFGPFRAVESRYLKNYIVKCAPNVYMNMHGWLNETLGTPRLSKIINKAQGFSKFINSYGARDHYIIAWVHQRLKIPTSLVEYKAPNKLSLTRDVNMINAIIKAYK